MPLFDTVGTSIKTIKWIQLEEGFAAQEQRLWNVAELTAVGAFKAWQVNERLR